jgi:NADH-quinone oxidoreductase subunit L
MGGLKSKMPLTFWTFLIYTLAISGVPLTSGFLSKDAILAGTLAYGNLTGHYLIPIVGFVVAGLTAFYMFRLLILTFLGEHKDTHRLESIHESPRVMTIPLVVFAVLSFFVFYSFNPFGASSGWLYDVIQRPASVVPETVAAVGVAEFHEAVDGAHTPAMMLSLLVAGLGIFIAFATYYGKKIDADAVAAKLAPVHRFLENKWYFDELYEATAVRAAVALANAYRWFDNSVIDGIVNGTASWTRAVTLGVRGNWEEGKVGAIVYLAVVGVVSVYAGVVAGMAIWPAEATVWSAVWHGVLALGVAGLAFFMFYAGAGGFDNRIVDGLVNATAYAAGFFGLLTRRVQTGKVQTYIAFVLLGVMVFFLWFR